MDTPFSSFEPDKPDPSRPRLREIPLRYIVPNLITVLAICAGLTGIRLAFEGRFELAVAMVLTAAFLDAVDGRIARAIKGTSKFGAQMDSLADIVNFGVAPGLVLYAYVLDQVRSMGWIAALLFAIACCLRLARFNVMLDDETRPKWMADYFTGVPAPAGALLVMLPVYLGHLGMDVRGGSAWPWVAYTVFIALLLVSSLPVYAGKTSTRVPREWVMPLILLVVAYVALLMSYVWTTLAATAFAYLVALPFSVRAYKKRLAAEGSAHVDLPTAGG